MGISRALVVVATVHVSLAGAGLPMCEHPMGNLWDARVPGLLPHEMFVKTTVLDQQALDSSTGVAVLRAVGKKFKGDNGFLMAVEVSTGVVRWTYNHVEPANKHPASPGYFHGIPKNGTVPVAKVDLQASSQPSVGMLVQLDTQTGLEVGHAYHLSSLNVANCSRASAGASCSLALLHNTQDILIVAVVVETDDGDITSIIHALSMAPPVDLAEKRFHLLWGGDLQHRFNSMPERVLVSPVGDAVFALYGTTVHAYNATDGARFAIISLLSSTQLNKVVDVVVTPDGRYLVALPSYPGRKVTIAATSGEDEPVTFSLPHVKKIHGETPFYQEGWLRFADDGDLRIVTDLSVYRCNVSKHGDLHVVRAIGVSLDAGGKDKVERAFAGAAIARDGSVVAWGSMALWQISSDVTLTRTRADASGELQTGLPDPGSGVADSDRGVFIYTSHNAVLAASLDCIHWRNPAPPMWPYVALGSVFVVGGLFYLYIRRKQRMAERTTRCDTLDASLSWL